MHAGQDVMEGVGGLRINDDAQFPIQHMIRDLAATAEIPVPELWLIPNEDVNAMAAGESPYLAAVGVYRGAINTLHPYELRAVLAHEVAHIALGQLRDRTSQALKLRGARTQIAGGAGLVIGEVIGHFHPLLGAGVKVASTAAMGYGVAQVNEAHAYNRWQESEADRFALHLGLGRPLASAFVRMSRVPPPSVVAEWSHALLFGARLDRSDHPQLSQRVAAALHARPGPPSVCFGCWRPLEPGATCPCPWATDMERCWCGQRLYLDDQFCGGCGSPVARPACRFCGRRDSAHLPGCAGCGMPLP